MNLKASVGLILLIIMMGHVTPSQAVEGEMLVFDRAEMHAAGIEESINPIRPGVPGETSFWNMYSKSFMYAPAFDFKPVEGAKSYRFNVRVYGSKIWTIEDATLKVSLESIWNEIPEGNVLVHLVYQNAKGRWRNSKQKAKPVEKKSSTTAPMLEFSNEVGNGKYRYTVQTVKLFQFEADEPCAALTPVWRHVPVGLAELTVEGLDQKGGNVIALAKIGKDTIRRFERRTTFNGSYHEAAMDYKDAGMRWLQWQSSGFHKKWKKEGNPKKLDVYPCKYEVAAISSLTALSVLEADPKDKDKFLQMARNAARTLIKGSYPADWGLAYLPPTYGAKKSYEKVVMIYPANAGFAYLDLYDATKEKEFMTAAVRIADAYKRLQLSNGSWPILMNAKSGEKASSSKTCIMPTRVCTFLIRLVKDHGLVAYQPVVDEAWKWIERDVLKQFRFEGQFEDGAAGRGGDRWHVSHHMAREIALYLLKNRKDDPASVVLAEEIIRWAEDQFLFWETPSNSKKIRFTPLGEEQHSGNLDFDGKGYSTEVGGFMLSWTALYEVTGNELYLAKATTLANAMTVMQKHKHGGNFVGTAWDWGKGSSGWPNCHLFCAIAFLKLGKVIEDRKMLVAVNPEFGAKIDWSTFKR